MWVSRKVQIGCLITEAMWEREEKKISTLDMPLIIVFDPLA
jgi:hypothetical protein